MFFTKLFLALFGNNWRVFVISLAVATIFWFFNALNKDYNTRLRYPLSFNFDRDSVVVVDQLPDYVTVDVSGGGWNLIRKTFLFSPDPIVIDLRDPTETKSIARASLLPIIRDQLSSLSIDYVVTDTLSVHIEAKISKTIRVYVDSLSIPLNDEFRLTTRVTVQPDSATVEGPKSMIDTLGSEYQIKLTQNDIDEDFDEDFSISFKNSLIRPLPDEVNVRFDVEEFNRASILIPIEVANFPSDSSIYLKDSVIQIYYTSRSRDLSKILESEFTITADLTMINEKDSTIQPVLIAFPYYAMELELVPVSLKVVYANP